jgi:predicted O-methyltransferase YrrM
MLRKKIVKNWLKLSPLHKIILAQRKILNTIRRYKTARGYYVENLRVIRKWSWKNTEDSNFYYDLTSHNLYYLAHFVGLVTKTKPELAIKYFREIENDTSLRAHILREFKDSNYEKEIELNFGRRVGWYAITRIIKPKVVVETGVDHGVGACILAAAIIKNRDEGFDGEYFGTDISDSAGQLLTGKYSEVGRILYGDSIDSLKKFELTIDLFINDSDHSHEYEYQEYRTIEGKLSKNAIILGDNAHVSVSLAKFSAENARQFYFFREVPKDHWYPGAGIGASTNNDF